MNPFSKNPGSPLYHLLIIFANNYLDHDQAHLKVGGGGGGGGMLFDTDSILERFIVLEF